MRRYLGGEWLPSPPLFCFSACWYLGSSWGRVRITQRLCGSRRLLTWWFFPKLWRKQWKEGRKEGRSLFCVFSSFLSLFLYVYLGFFYFFSSSFSLNIIFAFFVPPSPPLHPPLSRWKRMNSLFCFGFFS